MRDTTLASHLRSVEMLPQSWETPDEPGWAAGAVAPTALPDPTARQAYVFWRPQFGSVGSLFPAGVPFTLQCQYMAPPLSVISRDTLGFSL